MQFDKYIKHLTLSETYIGYGPQVKILKSHTNNMQNIHIIINHETGQDINPVIQECLRRLVPRAKQKINSSQQIHQSVVPQSLLPKILHDNDTSLSKINDEAFPQPPNSIQEDVDKIKIKPIMITDKDIDLNDLEENYDYHEEEYLPERKDNFTIQEEEIFNQQRQEIFFLQQRVKDVAMENSVVEESLRRQIQDYKDQEEVYKEQEKYFEEQEKEIQIKKNKNEIELQNLTNWREDWKESLETQKYAEFKVYQMKISELEQNQIIQTKNFDLLQEEKLSLLKFIVDEFGRKDFKNNQLALNITQKTMQGLIDQVDQKVQNEILNMLAKDNAFNTKQKLLDLEIQNILQTNSKLSQSVIQQQKKSESLVSQNLILQQEIKKMHSNQECLQNDMNMIIEQIDPLMREHLQKVGELKNESQFLYKTIAQAEIQRDLVKFAHQVKVKNLEAEIEELSDKVKNQPYPSYEVKRQSSMVEVNSAFKMKTKSKMIHVETDNTRKHSIQDHFAEQNIKNSDSNNDLDSLSKENFRIKSQKKILEGQYEDSLKNIDVCRIQIHRQGQDQILLKDLLSSDQTKYQAQLRQSQDKVIQLEQEQIKMKANLDQCEQIRWSTFLSFQKTSDADKLSILQLRKTNQQLQAELNFQKQDFQQSQLIQSFDPNIQEPIIPNLDLQQIDSLQFSDPTMMIKLEDFDDKYENIIEQGTNQGMMQELDKELTETLQAKQLNQQQFFFKNFFRKINSQKQQSQHVQSNTFFGSKLLPRSNSSTKKPIFKISKGQLSKSQLEYRIITDYEKPFTNLSISSIQKTSNQKSTKESLVKEKRGYEKMELLSKLQQIQIGAPQSAFTVVQAKIMKKCLK